MSVNLSAAPVEGVAGVAGAADAAGTHCTWAVLGAKGGAGCTVLTTSLAWAMAEAGLRVIVMDLDVTDGQAAMHLCERDAGPTLRDALFVLDRMDGVLLDTLLTPCGPRLRLLPSPRQSLWTDAEPDYGPQALDTLVRHAQQLADVVLLDLPARALELGGQGLVSQSWSHWLARLDQRVVVTEPTISATYSARRCLERLDAAGAAASWVVLNKVDRRDLISPEEVRTALLSSPSGRALGTTDSRDATAWRELPRSDRTVAHAVHHGLPVGQVMPQDPLARALMRWAQEAAQGMSLARAAQGAPGGAPAAHPGLDGRRRWRPLSWLPGGRA